MLLFLTDCHFDLNAVFNLLCRKSLHGGRGGKNHGYPGHPPPPPPATPLLYHDWVEYTPAFPSGQS